ANDLVQVPHERAVPFRLERRAGVLRDLVTVGTDVAKQVSPGIGLLVGVNPGQCGALVAGLRRGSGRSGGCCRRGDSWRLLPGRDSHANSQRPDAGEGDRGPLAQSVGHGAIVTKAYRVGPGPFGRRALTVTRQAHATPATATPPISQRSAPAANAASK